MKLPTIPKEVDKAIENILIECNGNKLAVFEEMVNTLPATHEGQTIRNYSKSNWEVLIKALVYGYEVE